MTEKAELIGLNKAELDRLMADIGEKPFRAKQLYQWLYVQGAVSFDEMTNLSKDLRAKLADKFTITRPKIVAEQLSRDKTHKWLLEFADGQRIETVYIPEADRGSIPVCGTIRKSQTLVFVGFGTFCFGKNVKNVRI